MNNCKLCTPDNCQQVEAALQQSQIKLNDILNSEIAAIISFCVFRDRRWEYSYYSAGCKKLFGYTAQELMADKNLWLSRILPEDKETVIFPIFDRFFAESTFTIEYRFYQKDGTLRWISDTYTSRRDTTADCWIVTTLATDITHRKQAEAALKESEERFRSLFENVSVGMAIVSLSGQIIAANEFDCHFLGYSKAELIGMHFTEFTHPEDIALDDDLFASLITGERNRYVIDKRYLRKDGTIVWGRLSVSLIKNEDGSLRYIAIVCEDINTQKQAEQALLVSQARFAGIVEIANDAIVSINSQEKIILFNQGAEKIFGYTSDEVLGQPLTLLLPAKICNAHSQHVKNFAQFSGKARQMGEKSNIFGRCKNGKEFPAEASISKLKVDGETIYTAIIRDITDRKQTEEKLKQRVERERLLGTITQRIRQSLNLEEILTTTVIEIRQLLQADRVLIYRVYPDGRGCVITESTAADCAPILGKPLPPEIFPLECYPLYRGGRIRTVTDVEKDQMSPCLADTLRELGVQSKIVVPILCHSDNWDEQREDLWGLLIAHQCASTREWQSSEIDLLQQLAAQSGIAIQQSQLYERTQLQAEREKALNRVIRAIRNSLNLPTLFDTAVAEIGNLLQAENAVINQYYSEQKVWRNLVAYAKDSNQPNPVGVEFPDEGNPIADQLKQLEVIRLNDARTYPERVNQQVAQLFPGTWLMVPVHFDSFVWGAIGIRRHLELPWQDDEVELACTVADQLAIAIHQSQLYQQLAAANQELQQQATLDGLTQIANRRRFDEYLNTEWKRHERNQQCLSLILLDVDYFKRYNDTYGHLAGDDCLRQVAQTLKNVVCRPTDLVARYGGEEFAIILPHTDAQGAVHVAETIHRTIQQIKIPHTGSKVSNYVTVSLGVATMIPSRNRMVQDIINVADQALYIAKQQGRDRCFLLTQ